MWKFAEIRNVGDVVRYWARHTPSKTALTEGGHRLDYAELDRRANAVAHRLAAAGVGRGETVGYLGKNSIEFWIVWFAAAKMGCLFAPMNWRLAVPELAAILDDARPPVLFAEDDLGEKLRKVFERTAAQPELVLLDPATPAGTRLDGWFGDAASHDPDVEIRREDGVLLSYTSGTTGLSKGVVATHDAFQYSFLCQNLEPALSRKQDDILVMSMPNFHLGGSWVSIAALYAGGTIAVLPSFDPDELLTMLRRDRPTIVPLVPTAIQLLVSRSDITTDDFSSVRSVIYFGSPIGQQLLNEALKKLDCEFCQSYGTTEAYFCTILRHEDHLSGSAAKLGSCGRALPMVQARIVDASGAEVPHGTVGQLLVYTPMMMAGYRDRPDATAEVLQDGWYQTGDLARMGEDGFITVVDRAKDMIISGGENVYSAEVEKALSMHPAVVMAAVIGTADEKWGEMVTALVVAKPGLELTEREIQDHCRLHIAGYKVPKKVIFEQALPMTPSGKIQKAVLRERYRSC